MSLKEKCALLSLLFFSPLLTHCSVSESEEAGQQLGDVMVSIDEAGGSGGSLASLETRPMRRLEGPNIFRTLEEMFEKSAHATACALASTFGECASNTLTRTFGGCTIGGAALTGTVTLTWGGVSAASCAMGAANDSVTRVPDFTVTGRRGATLTSFKTGSMGQRLTWTSGSGSSRVFSFANDGIRRVFTSASGSAVLDFTTETLSPITVTGGSRANRSMNGGQLRVTNNLAASTCDYVPREVTWSATCNCPTSGTWTGTCSDGKTSALTLTGCGTGSFSLGSDIQTVSFDRCYGL